MTARHVLYLTNECIVCLVARSGNITGRAVFPASGPGRADFESYLKGLRSLPANVITDFAEEDFRLDTIPHLGSRDREMVLTRRLSQLFRNSPFRHAFVQGRETEGRRDDRVVYTSITNADMLRPWTEILERLEVPVEGIHSSAVFSGRLLEDLQLVFPHALLVTFTPGNAVRQTYFFNKEIRFSRLSPLVLEPGDSLGGFLAGETARTWQYLDSLRSFGADDHLEVCLVAHQRDRPAIEPMLRDSEQLHYRMIDIEQAAAKIGMKPAPATSSAETILAHLFLRRSVRNHYAPPELRRFAVLRRTRFAILTAAAAVFAAGLAYGGWNLSFAIQSREKIRQNEEQAATLDREREGLLRSIPSEGAAGQTMRDSVAFYSGPLRSYPTVRSFLLPISTVLDRYPGIRLSQIQWQTADDDKVTPALVPMAPRSAPPLKAVASGRGPVVAQAPPPRAIGPAEGPFVTGMFAVALLEATVKVEGLGFRDALAKVRSLVDDVDRLEGYHATLVDSPLDLATGAAIQGKFGDRTPGESEARFSVKVTRKTETGK